MAFCSLAEICLKKAESEGEKILYTPVALSVLPYQAWLHSNTRSLLMANECGILYTIIDDIMVFWCSRYAKWHISYPPFIYYANIRNVCRKTIVLF